MDYQSFSPRENITIAYHKLEAGARPELPGVVFLGGFMSDMQGSKATFLEQLCKEQGRAYLRFDYTGHGKSSGKFTDGTIGSWAQDALDVLDHLTTGPQIIIGSSMGGWISILTALKRPERITGFIGIAAAPDFTERMYRDELSDQQRHDIKTMGITYVPSDYGEPYPITRALIDDGKNQMVMKNETINISVPTRLLHGKSDTAVPWQISTMIQNKFISPDVKCHYIPDGDHSLSREQDLIQLQGLLNEITATIIENTNTSSQTA